MTRNDLYEPYFLKSDSDFSDDSVELSDDDYKLDWDKIYPTDPSLQCKYIHERWEESLPQLIVGPFNIPMFPNTNEMHYSYRTINSKLMKSNNLDIFARFLSFINMDFIKTQSQILYLYIRSHNIDLNSQSIDILKN